MVVGRIVLAVGVVVAPSTALASLSAAASSITSSTILVDDDGGQCADAGFSSIAEAMAAAMPGDTVQVCPGSYTEFVYVDVPVTLIGLPEAVDALDCFDHAESQPDDLDPSTYAVLNRPADTPGNLLTIASPGVTVSGLVLQGATTTDTPEAPQIADAAIHLMTASTGATVQNNLIRLSSLGIDMGSDGGAVTRVDHNCLRDNEFGMASQRQDLVGAEVEHNETFRTEQIAYEVGWSRASTHTTSFAHNVSRADVRTFFVHNSTNISIADNDAEPAFVGAQVASGNRNVRITDNRIVGGTGQGVMFSTVAGQPASQKMLVAGNEIRGFGLSATTGLGIAIATNAAGQPAVDGVKVMDNFLTKNGVGLSLQLANLGIRVHGNTINANRQFGIRAQLGAGSNAGASFKDNTLLGNGSPAVTSTADAFDADRPANTWSNNVCERDIPMDTICGR